MAVTAALDEAAAEVRSGRNEVRLRGKDAPWSRSRAFRWLLVSSVVVLALGAIENLYGLTDSGDVYGSDAVQYLDIARALGRHDWTSALNPLWSQGYPALLALLRPLFAAGPLGDWRAVRTLNVSVFAVNYLCLLFLLTVLSKTFAEDEARPRRVLLLWVGGLSIFVATQVCFGQVSRVNPDELVTAMLLLACGLLVRMLYGEGNRRHGFGLGVSLGLVLGVGFLVKAVFLPLGLGILLIAAVSLRRRRQRVAPLLAAALLFAVLTGSYGVLLSRAVGHPTLGESGSLNYAWHVNRLQKWVHWRGGTEPAADAWPKPALARFAQWDAHPPDFGTPLHPSAVLQASPPLVYGFGSAPVQATYVPYFDPPYWYAGYKHVVRWRYQLIALGKSTADLVASLLPHPMLYAMLLALASLLASRTARQAAAAWARQHGALLVIGLLGFLIYLPVHLEGRYLAGFLLLLGIYGLAAGSAAPTALTPSRLRLLVALLLAGVAGDLLHTQRPVWNNLAVHRIPGENVEWQMGEAAFAEGLPPGAPVGVIAWTPNLHCDWAYIAHLRIVSEIATGTDFDLFWKQPPATQLRTLDAFRRSGAVAVFVNGKPAGADLPGWKQLGETPLWMYRL